MHKKVLMISRGAVIAAIYVTVTILFQPISYGAVQIRVSEALTVLPFLWVEAVPGLFVGCLIANIFGGLGLLDIALGSLATLAAAVISKFAPNEYFAATSPVVVNAIVVGAYLSYLTNTPLAFSILYIACGEAIACYALGIPLLRFLRSLGILVKK
ncbi:MAG: QueT transporter family protein [Synergistaceae bacterium]|jgi:uncharacterized membrane protein|nr:QueT transporter family protein [Synergistaceae bacterium]